MMPPPKGKTVALWTSALAAVTLLAAGVAFKKVALEYWYIYRLESRDLATRMRATQKLAELQSRRAVPHLMRRLRIDPGSPRGSWNSSITTIPLFFDCLDCDLQQRTRGLCVAWEWKSWLRLGRRGHFNWAGEALVKIGRAARPELLHQALQDSPREARLAALEVLRVMGGAEMFRAIVCGLADEDPTVASFALYMLQVLGPENRVAVVPHLLDALREQKLEATDAILLLGTIGKRAEEAVPSLRAILDDPTEDRKVRCYAAGALAKITGAPVSYAHPPRRWPGYQPEGTHSEGKPQSVLW